MTGGVSAAVEDIARARVQWSRIPARIRIATIAMNVSGAFRQVPHGEGAEHDRRHADRDHDDRGVAAGLGAQPEAGDSDEDEDHEPTALPTEAMAERSTAFATIRTRPDVMSSPDLEPSREPGPKNAGNSPSCASIPVRFDDA